MFGPSLKDDVKILVNHIYVLGVYPLNPCQTLFLGLSSSNPLQSVKTVVESVTTDA